MRKYEKRTFGDRFNKGKEAKGDKSKTADKQEQKPETGKDSSKTK